MKERFGLSEDDITVELVKAYPEVIVELIHKVFDIINEQEKQIQMLTQKVEELEARLNKDSSNSSKLPSSDNPYHKPVPKSLRPKSAKAPGGQKGHKRKYATTYRNP